MNTHYITDSAQQMPSSQAAQSAPAQMWIFTVHLSV